MIRVIAIAAVFFLPLTQGPAQGLAQQTEILFFGPTPPAPQAAPFETSLSNEFGGLLGLSVDNNNGDVEVLSQEGFGFFFPQLDALPEFSSFPGVNTTGDDFGFAVRGSALPMLFLYVPEDFVSGSTLSGSAIFPDLTFDDLSPLIGVTSEFGDPVTPTNPSNAQAVGSAPDVTNVVATLQIVPEPVAGWLICLGGVILSVQRRRDC